MRQYIDGNVVANRVRLLRTQHSGSFLIVEGDTDKRFYERFIDRDQCRIIIANNKANAVAASAILERDKFRGVLTIVDADFEMLEPAPDQPPHLIRTDDHDVEAMLIRSPALEKVLAEFGSEAKIAANPDVRERMVESGKPLGYLRWHSLRANLGLRFDELQFSRFLDPTTLNVERRRLVSTLKNHSQKPHLVEQDLLNGIEQLTSSEHDAWQVCCGHDLVEILAVGLQRMLGTNAHTQVRPEIIARSLRLAYESVHFRTTRLYAAIERWEQENPPFIVLARSL
jgi:hypothetical protein